MKGTEFERKESTKRCCGSGWAQRDSAEHEGYAGALIERRITEKNVANADRPTVGLPEQIIKANNLNRAYKRVRKNNIRKDMQSIVFI